MFTISIVLIAWIFATTRSEEAPSIAIGVVETQLKNRITIDENGLPPGSVVIGGASLTQKNNQYLTVADTNQLTIVMADMINLPTPLTILGLNDTEMSNFLNVSRHQLNAQVIINLRKSLTYLEELCEATAQLVDRSLIENYDHPKKSSEYGWSVNTNKKLWYSTLRIYWLKAASCKRTLSILTARIHNQQNITDLNVEKARSRMSDLLLYHKKMAEKSQRVISPA